MTPADREQLTRDTKTAESARGPVLRAYQDTKGVWTIGYGTNLQELTIDAATAETWLTEKLQSAERECGRFPWFAGLASRRQAALVEMVYNMGMPRLLGFTNMLQAFADGDFEWAATEALDSKWAGDVGPTRAGRIAAMIRQG